MANLGTLPSITFVTNDEGIRVELIHEVEEDEGDANGFGR
jgi:hypothetical protein